MTVNAALADILDRQAAETEAEQLLAALVDHGVFVPVQESGSVSGRVEVISREYDDPGTAEI